MFSDEPDLNLPSSTPKSLEAEDSSKVVVIPPGVIATYWPLMVAKPEGSSKSIVAGDPFSRPMIAPEIVTGVSMSPPLAVKVKDWSAKT